MDQIYQLQQQIQKMRQELNEITQMTSQLQQFEQSNAAQISRIQQHESNASQQLQRIQQMCNQVNQDLSQLNSIAQQLSTFTGTTTGVGQLSMAQQQPQTFGYAFGGVQQQPGAQFGYTQPMYSAYNRPGSQINLNQPTAGQTGATGQFAQQYTPHFTGNQQGFNPSIQGQQNFRQNQPFGPTTQITAPFQHQF